MQKNKSLATLLAFLLGGAGLHRFYLYGKKDVWAWLHLASLPLSGLGLLLLPGLDPYFPCLPLSLSVLAAWVETLVIGLTPDAAWDAKMGNAQPSDTRWPIAVLLVLTLGVGATGLIWTIARLFDLLYTGGAYG
ncbi:NINE protein [Massilia sp. TS11]|uniref:NINE protein n=1 Tax=Massilia sp. TS11 TaxID=2908003 RepID=UPI001EDBE3C8|nr:NINE protein [Massilia sp. TS11]MCG2585673.1 TM2 domain-containing protein [Massilia sp. TS11]